MRSQLQSKRLFLAILPNEAVVRALLLDVNSAIKMTKKIRPVSAELMHLTLGFLGQINHDREQDIQEVMKKAVVCFHNAGYEAFNLSLGPIDVFKKRKGGGILWRGIMDDAGAEALDVLREFIYETLANSGVEIDKRFTPHFTLGRGVQVSDESRESSDPKSRHLDELCQELNKTVVSATCHVGAIHLMWSHRPEPLHKLTYTSIAKVSL